MPERLPHIASIEPEQLADCRDHKACRLKRTRWRQLQFVCEEPVDLRALSDSFHVNTFWPHDENWHGLFWRLYSAIIGSIRKFMDFSPQAMFFCWPPCFNMNNLCQLQLIFKWIWWAVLLIDSIVANRDVVDEEKFLRRRSQLHQRRKVGGKLGSSYRDPPAILLMDAQHTKINYLETIRSTWQMACCSSCGDNNLIWLRPNR